MSDRDPNVSAEALSKFCEEALVAVGASRDHAEAVSASLVDADLRGLESHGVPARLPGYVSRVRAGGIVPDASCEAVSDQGSVIILDARDGFGQVAAQQGMDMAIERASVHGTGFVAVRRSNHLGALGYWSRRATQNGMVGFAVSGAAPRIAPWGSAVPLLATNPWSIAYPNAGDRPPVLVDVSNGAVLSGELVRAEEGGDRIPLGWALDSEGRPTDDPKSARAGSMLPFGGAKGAALTLALEVLGSVLTGAAYSRHVPPLEQVDKPQRLGHLFVALAVDRFLPLAEFESRVDELMRLIEDSQPAGGPDGIRVPGARGTRLRQERLARGIPLHEHVEPLEQLARELGIAPLDVR